MKTVSSIAGVRPFDDHDVNMVPVFLRDILVEIRGLVVGRVAKNLMNYIRYKHVLEATPKELANIRQALLHWQLSPIEVESEQFRGILTEVLSVPHTYVDTGLFLARIDQIIEGLIESRNMPWDIVKITKKDNVIERRQRRISELLTEKGLISFVANRYNERDVDPFKIKYLVDELREHFAAHPINYDELVPEVAALSREDGLSTYEATDILFAHETEELLDEHFKKTVTHSDRI